MGNRTMLAGLALAAAISACAPPKPLPTITPTVTQTPAVVVEVTQFPTDATATHQAAIATPSLTAQPVVQPTSTSPYVITPAAPPATSSISTVVPGTYIEYFRAAPSEINPGESFTLTWKVKTGSVVLWRIQPTGQFGASETVSLEGSKQIQTSTTERNFVQYMLYVEAGGQSEMQTLTIKLSCLDTWFMDNPPTDCPASSATLTRGVYQQFANGYMIWVEASYRIYVLFSDSNSPRWSMFSDPWAEGMAEKDDSLVPPDGLYQPVRGFGEVWRNQPGMRDRLGWASAPESTFQTALQCNSAPKYTTCYLKTPMGVIMLQPESSGWVIWTGPTPPP